MGRMDFMELEIMPKQDKIPDYDREALAVQYIDAPFIDDPNDVTEDSIAEILKRIPTCVEAYLFLDPDGEDSFLEVLSDGEWLALGCSFDGGQENYYSYNASYADSKDWTPLRSGGQSPVEKYLALTDLEAGAAAVEYFIRTGKLYPGIDWAKQR